ncbi:MAG: type II secretion system protein M [Pseudomonadota bacterium]|mgnify:CR=1 FL=1
MKAWFASLAPRERVMVIAAALLSVLTLGYVLIWEPLTRDVVRLEQAVQEQRALKQWMEQAAVEARRLRGGGGNGAAPVTEGSPSLLSVADETVRAAQLGPAVRRIEPEGDSVVRVVLEQAAFDDVMLWLGGLQRTHGVSVVDLAVDRQSEPGRVNARLTLKRGS